MGLYGENPTEFGKSSSHVCLHACGVEKNLRWMPLETLRQKRVYFFRVGNGNPSSLFSMSQA